MASAGCDTDEIGWGWLKQAEGLRLQRETQHLRSWLAARSPQAHRCSLTNATYKGRVSLPSATTRMYSCVVRVCVLLRSVAASTFDGLCDPFPFLCV